MDNPVSWDSVVEICGVLRPFMHDDWGEKALPVCSGEEKDGHPERSMLAVTALPDLFGHAILPRANNSAPLASGVNTNFILISCLRGAGLEVS